LLFWTELRYALGLVHHQHCISVEHLCHSQRVTIGIGTTVVL
jgi:hypothetical protein